jgi:molecular chaperone GrpE
MTDPTKRDSVEEMDAPEPAAASDARRADAGDAPASDPETLRRERDDYYDRLLRKTAEFDNYRKRTDRERREMADTAAADVLRDLLPIVDDLERALRADVGAEGLDAYRRGVEIVLKQVHDLLRRRGVRPIEAVGQPFDPHVHEAVAHEVSPAHREGDVIEEFRRGYMLGERLLRPAMVKVAKA